MDAENLIADGNLEDGIQNMNIGPHQNGIDQGNNQIGDVGNHVLIEIEDENAGNREILELNQNIQQNQGEIREQPPGQNNAADALAGDRNQDPFAVNNNQNIPADAAGARNNERIHLRNQRIQHFPVQRVQNNFLRGNDIIPAGVAVGNQGVAGNNFPLGQMQDNIPRGNAPAAIDARNQGAFGFNQNNQRQQQFQHQIQRDNAGFMERNERPLGFNYQQRQNRLANEQGYPINHVDHHRAPNVYRDPNQQAPQYQIQNQNEGEFPQIHQNDGNIHARGNFQNRANQEMQGFQHAGRLAGNNNENIPPVAHQLQDQRNALQIPAEPYANHNANREAVEYNRHNNRQNNRHAPYVNMRRMSQNAKKMAMMVWSMAEAAMYVPNHYNNNLPRNNPQDRDDDGGSQYGQ